METVEAANKNFTNVQISHLNFDLLYPTILQCMALILSGFLAVKVQLISHSEVKGIRHLVTYFLAPAIIFQNLVQIKLNVVNWSFVAAVILAKAIVFACVSLVTYASSRNLAKSGIYGIFATTSNNIAIGWPIADALFHDTHPEFANEYLYLFIPCSLLIVNPIGFAMMEIHRAKSNQNVLNEDSSDTESDKLIEKSEGQCALFWNILTQLVRNPLVLATLLGFSGTTK